VSSISVVLGGGELTIETISTTVFNRGAVAHVFVAHL
jgi:hypothetical protein